MHKQSSFRNHRSKGIKVRHVLQICLLLAVCFWLIYQVKHSRDKKNEFDETDDDRASLERSNSDEGLRLGRKDIRSRVEETAYNNEKHDQSDENIQEDEDENKLEEDDVEENKIEHNVDDSTSHEKADAGEEDEATEGENEEIDEHEREGSDDELDREEEFVNDEKEKQENDDSMAEETDSGTEKIRIEKDIKFDSDGVNKNTHDAHEEHYKADDSSSAVSQDTHEKPGVENKSLHSKDVLVVENKGSDDVEDANKVENRKDLEVETSKDDKESNIKASDQNELMLDKSEKGSPPNGTVTQGSEDTFTSYNSTEVAVNNHDSSLMNATEKDNKLDHGSGNLNETASNEVSISDTVASELMNNSRLSEDSNGRDDSNSTRDSESNSESAPERVITSEEASAETHNNTELLPKEKGDIGGERSDTNNNNTDESLESTYHENPEVAGHDSIDISDSNNTLEETDVRRDIDNLPVIQSEQTDDDGTAAE